MSALQVGHAFDTFRTRMPRPSAPAAATDGAGSGNCSALGPHLALHFEITGGNNDMAAQAECSGLFIAFAAHRETPGKDINLAHRG